MDYATLASHAVDGYTEQIVLESFPWTSASNVGLNTHSVIFPGSRKWTRNKEEPAIQLAATSRVIKHSLGLKQGE
jgi:hypothetical protein